MFYQSSGLRKNQHKLIKKRLSSVSKVLEPLLQRWENQVIHFQKSRESDSNYSNLNYRDFLVQEVRLCASTAGVGSIPGQGTRPHMLCSTAKKNIFFFKLYKCVIKYIILKTVVRNIQNCLHNKWINTTSKRPSKGRVSHTPGRLMLINPGSANFKSLGFSYLLLPRKQSQNLVH